LIERDRAIVTPRSPTLSDVDIELPRIVMGEEVSLDRLCGDAYQINSVLAGLSLSLGRTSSTPNHQHSLGKTLLSMPHPEGGNDGKLDGHLHKRELGNRG